MKTTWLRFWTNLWLPGWGLLILYSGFLFLESHATSAHVMTGAIKIVLGFGYIVLATAMYKRLSWAWKLNLLVVFGQPAMFSFGIALLFMVPVEEGDAALRGYAFNGLVTAIVFGAWAFWSWTNYVYFLKRRSLFR